MSERFGDPNFEEYSWTDHERFKFMQAGHETSERGYPKPIHDYSGWTPGQREVNGRLQQLFRGNVYDAVAPSFSERFKPGFDPNSIPPSANAALDGPGMSFAFGKAGLNVLNPFGLLGKAEDVAEQALGKQIWHRESPEEKEVWWLKNHD